MEDFSLRKEASFIPKQLFEGADSMYHNIGPMVTPIVISISRRLQPSRKVATLSFAMMISDFNIDPDNHRHRVKCANVLNAMRDKEYIDFDDLSKVKVRDAFEIKVYYETEPFILLYEQEFHSFRYLPSRDPYKILLTYLYVVKHINDYTKQPAWVSVERIAEDLGFSIASTEIYLRHLRDTIGILKKIGTKAVGQHLVSLHTRNMHEYIHMHKSTGRRKKTDLKDELDGF